MKQNSTELVFILDRSGSMGGLERDTIGGYNAMLGKQQLVDGECRITTVLFDNSYELLHDRIDLKNVMSAAVASFREVGAVDATCFEEIRKDVKRRGGRK